MSPSQGYSRESCAWSGQSGKTISETSSSSVLLCVHGSKPCTGASQEEAGQWVRGSVHECLPHTRALFKGGFVGRAQTALPCKELLDEKTEVETVTF